MSTAQMMVALFGAGRQFSDTPRGRALKSLLWLRSHRAWIKPGSYAWWRFTDDIERARRQLILARKGGGE